MNLKKNQVLLNAALAGIFAASTLGAVARAVAADKAGSNSEAGLCSNSNSSCSGTGACGQTKGKNDCSGHGNSVKTKAECDTLAKGDTKAKHTWMAMPKTKM